MHSFQQLHIGERQGSFDGMLSTRTFLVVAVGVQGAGAGLPFTQHYANVTYDGTPQIVIPWPFN